MKNPAPVDTQAIEIVEVSVASRTLPGWQRDLRLLLGAAALAALLVFGVTAHVLDLGRGAAGPRGGGGAVATIAPIGAPSEPTASTVAAEATLVASGAGGVVRGSTIVLAGVARQPIAGAVLEARLGKLSLGRRTLADLPSGPFELALPVYAPPNPALVDVEMAGANAAAPIVSTSIVLSARFAVDVWSISSRRVGGTCRVHAEGPARLGIPMFRVDVVDDGSALVGADVTVAEDTTSGPARFLGLGRWAQDFGWPSPHGRPAGGRTLRLEISWRDPTDGTSSRLSVPFVPCVAG